MTEMGPQKMKEKEVLFENETPHFFKIFRTDEILTTRLGIPRKFARKYGGRLSDPVRLRVPTGDCWEVRLEKEDGTIFLREGWAEFVKHYQISRGCFVVFRFEGGSRFRVIVLNGTACEIDYSVKPNQPTLIPKSEEVDVDEAVRPVEFYGKKRKKELLSGHSPRSSKVMTRGKRAGKASCSSTKRDLPIKISTPSGAKQTRGTFNRQLNSNSLKTHTAAAKAANTSGVLARACSYKCRRPSFVVIVGRSCLHGHFMYLPRKFLELGILKNGEVGTMTLSVSDQKTWTVGYRYAGRCTVSRGWKEFVSENGLRAGDVLVFELIRITKVAFHVVIFRNNVASRPRPSSERRKRFAVKPAHKTRPSRRPTIPDIDVAEENPSFEAVISRRDASGCRYVPVHFAKALRQASDSTNDMATLKVGQLSWPVELRNNSKGSDALNMAGGWTRFMQANDLWIGDICMFKLVDKDNTVIEVSIRRKTRRP